MTAPLPRLTFDAPWSAETVWWSSARARFVLGRDGGHAVTVDLSRCARGRLRRAYPVAARDVEVQLPDVIAADDLTTVLRVVAQAVRESDPLCRKVIHAVDCDGTGGRPLGGSVALAAAERAGFRHVVDVDIAEAQLSLLVAEPDWVTEVDIDLDRVPGA